LCLWPGASDAQSPEGGNPWFLRTGLAAPRIISNNPFVESPDQAGDSIQWGRNLTIEVGRQTDGSKEWHQLYGIPSYGFGFSLASFSNASLTAGRPRRTHFSPGRSRI
jgi:hypothetical protein